MFNIKIVLKYIIAKKERFIFFFKFIYCATMMKLRLLLLKPLEGKNLIAAVGLRYVSNKKRLFIGVEIVWSIYTLT